VCFTKTAHRAAGFFGPGVPRALAFLRGKPAAQLGRFSRRENVVGWLFLLSCGSFPFSLRAGRRRRAAEAASRMRGIRIAQLCHRPSPGAQKSAPASPRRRGEAREFALARTPAALFVIAGLDPAIQAESSHLRACRMDARVEPAHDEKRNAVSKNLCWCGYPPPQPSPSRGEKISARFLHHRRPRRSARPRTLVRGNQRQKTSGAFFAPRERGRLAFLFSRAGGSVASVARMERSAIRVIVSGAGKSRVSLRFMRATDWLPLLPWREKVASPRSRRAG
jgi:hypothetical protein